MANFVQVPSEDDIMDDELLIKNASRKGGKRLSFHENVNIIVTDPTGDTSTETEQQMTIEDLEAKYGFSQHSKGMGSKVRSMPNFVEENEKRAAVQGKMRRVKSTGALQNLTRGEVEIFMDTQLIALPSISSRANTFYRNQQFRHSQLQLAGQASGPLKLPVLDDSVTLYLLWCVFQGLMPALVYGWHISATNLPSTRIERYLDIEDNMFALCVSSMFFAAIPGSFLGGYLSETLGRKNALLVCDVLFIGGGVLFWLCERGKLWQFLTGRVIVGIASGAACAVIPAYLGEISPTRIRGTIGSCFQLTVCFGIFASFFVGKKGWLLEDWQLVLGMTVVPPTINIFSYCFFCESPAWLLRSKRKEEAKEALRKLRARKDVEWEIILLSKTVNSSDSEDESDDELDTSLNGSSGLKVHSNDEKKKPLLAFDDRKKVKEGLWGKLSSDKGFRKAFIICCVLMVAQQFSGINSVFFYSKTICDKVGANAWLGSSIIGAANVLGVAAAAPLLDKMGRTFWLKTCCIVMSVAAICAIVGLKMTEGDNPQTFWGYFMIFSLCLYTFAFELGLGPIPWLISAEIIPTAQLSTVMGISTAVNGCCAAAIGQVFPMMTSSLKYLSYMPFLVVLILTYFFVQIYVPETKGLRVDEVQKLLRGEPAAPKKVLAFASPLAQKTKIAY